MIKKENGQFSPKVANQLPFPDPNEDETKFMNRCMLKLSPQYGDETAAIICGDQYFRVNKARDAFSINKAKKMKKQKLDRLKRYGYKEDKLHEITQKVLEFNNQRIAERLTRMSKRSFDKKAKKLGLDPKRLTFPELDDLFPGRAVFVKKAAQNGRLIADNLRNELGAKLRKSMREKGLTTLRGVTAGQVRRDLIEDFEKHVQKSFEGFTKRDKKLGMPPNIHAIAVTEVRGSVNEIKEKYTKKLIDTNNLTAKKRWIHNRSLSKIPRRGHQKLDGKTIGMDKKFEVELYQNNKLMGKTSMSRPHDPLAPAAQVINCLPGSEKVYSPGLKAATRMKYSGSIIRFETRTGLQFATTPNHPVLTDSGWVPAKKLAVGQNVITVDSAEIVNTGKMNIQSRPAMISEIFDSLFESGYLVRKCRSYVDFHGDRPDGDIDIVSSYSQLMDGFESSFFNHIDEPQFSRARLAFRSLISFGSIMGRFLRDRFSPRRLVGLLGQALLLLRGHFGIPVVAGFFSPSSRNAVLNKSFSNGSFVNFVDFSQFKLGNAGSVISDQLTHIQISNSSCHVYNLHTESGFYYAGINDSSNKSIVLHNCNCDVDYIVAKEEISTQTEKPSIRPKGGWSFFWAQRKTGNTVFKEE